MANHDLEKDVQGFSQPVTDLFLTYDWPGNLREMKNIIKRSVLLTKGDMVLKEVLPQEMFDNPYQGKTESEFQLYSSKDEEKAILDALERTRFNKTKAAQLLGIDRKTLYNKIKLYNIEL